MQRKNIIIFQFISTRPFKIGTALLLNSDQLYAAIDLKLGHNGVFIQMNATVECGTSKWKHVKQLLIRKS